MATTLNKNGRVISTTGVIAQDVLITDETVTALDGSFPVNLNKGMVELDTLEPEDFETIKSMIESHTKYTGSALAAEILADWATASKKFAKVMPVDFKKVLKAQREAAAKKPVLAAAGE